MMQLTVGGVVSVGGGVLAVVPLEVESVVDVLVESLVDVLVDVLLEVDPPPPPPPPPQNGFRPRAGTAVRVRASTA